MKEKKTPPKDYEEDINPSGRILRGKTKVEGEFHITYLEPELFEEYFGIKLPKNDNPSRRDLHQIKPFKLKVKVKIT